MIKAKIKKISIGVGVLLFVSLAIFGLDYIFDKEEDQMTGASSFTDAKWVVVDSFSGYETKLDPTKVGNGANPQGQNTTPNDKDRVSVRQEGLALFPEGTASTTTDGIKSLYTFRKRNGENIMIRTYGTFMEYYEEGNDTWEYLRSNLTSGKEFDFGMYNINTDLTSYVYFGNAFDNAARWTGAHSLSNGVIATSSTDIIIDDISGFTATGTIRFCNATTTYTGINLTTHTFTLTSTAGAACADNRGVIQDVEEMVGDPIGNIYLVANNRLFISGVASTSQAVFFSEYGDATNFVGASLVTDDTDTSPGIFNFGTGGGAVTGMALDENSIYIFKRSAIWRATLTDTIYTLTILKPVDDKAQTTGAVNNKSIFTGHNAVYFITPDNQIMSLQRVEQIDYPQIIPISDIIQTTVNGINPDNSTGIVFREKAYFSVKADTDVSSNNAVFIRNINENIWDSPTVGWNVSDFTIYDDGTSEELYVANVTSPNVYMIDSSGIDDIYEVVANWRSKQYSFGMPQQQKEIVDLFVEGYISQNTTLNISLLLDEDGYTGSYTTTVVGTDEDLVYNSTDFNRFGLSTFGTQRFGSNEDQSGNKKFRVYLTEMRADPFYNMQLEFASDGEAQNWEIISYGMRVRPYSVEQKRSLFQPFK